MLLNPVNGKEESIADHYTSWLQKSKICYSASGFFQSIVGASSNNTGLQMQTWGDWKCCFSDCAYKLQWCSGYRLQAADQ
jgi:hypothetical protein